MNIIEKQIKKCWFRTFSGKLIDPENPEPSDITSIDIARSLSLQCRYGGQISFFYSVAEHSLLVRKLIMSGRVNKADELSWENCRAWELEIGALLHDSTEAYISDIPTPFKKLLPGYYDLEKKLLKVIHRKYNLKLNSDEEKIIDFYDKKVLEIEMPYLFNDPNYQHKLSCYDSNTSFSLYLNALLQYE